MKEKMVKVVFTGLTQSYIESVGIAVINPGESFEVEESKAKELVNNNPRLFKFDNMQVKKGGK